MATVTITIKDELDRISIRHDWDPPVKEEQGTGKLLDPTPAQLLAQFMLSVAERMLGAPDEAKSGVVSSSVVPVLDMGGYYISADNNGRGN